MAVTLTEVETALETGLSLVSTLAPLAALGGLAAGSIGVTVGQVASLADTLVTQISGDAAIIAGGNLTAITTLQAKLQAANATLGAQIAAS
jgi:hypothetical protein